MITNLTTTEIEELRIAIAEEMGWKREWINKERRIQQWVISRPDGSCDYCDPDPSAEWETQRLPPYITSIDSIREAAMERFECPLDQYKFQYDLESVYNEQNHYQEWKLTALDWAIAFARTAKIWRFKV